MPWSNFVLVNICLGNICFANILPWSNFVLVTFCLSKNFLKFYIEQFILNGEPADKRIVKIIQVRFSRAQIYLSHLVCQIITFIKNLSLNCFFRKIILHVYIIYTCIYKNTKYMFILYTCMYKNTIIIYVYKTSA